ncbi:hypothetical protein D9613_000648 [Agrocybe pediades]|uniref:Uncharacterized protein n=1 Tax=Agrocybe pediades TaxID=84607 RepID=A0A8H4R0I4_9AGAR|nr:hypothetical protein D9613_000648 [Agrocybe pediades]
MDLGTSGNGEHKKAGIVYYGQESPSHRHGSDRTGDTSTPPVTSSGTESDGRPSPSLYDLDAFDFPAPPPMLSPTIRRIKSSPWFNMAEDRYGEGTSVNRWRADVSAYDCTQMKRHSHAGIGTTPGAQRDSIGGCSDETYASGTRRHHHKFCSGEQQSPNIFCSDASIPRSEDKSLATGSFLFFGDTDTRVRNDIPSASGSCPDRSSWSIPTTARDSGELSSRLSHRMSNYQDQRPNALTIPYLEPPETHHSMFGPLPRIIRKVASMRSDNPHKQEASVHDISHVAGQRQVSKRRSLRTIFRPSSERVSADDVRLRHKSNVDARCPQFSFDTNLRADEAQSHPQNTLNTSQRGWPAHDSGGGGDHRVRFDKNLARTNDPYLAGPGRGKEELLSSRSFIDITPDKTRKSTEGARKERFKTLMTRASISLFGWKKAKANQSSSCGIVSSDK